MVNGSGNSSSSGGGWHEEAISDEALQALAEKIGEQQRRVAASGASHLGGDVDRAQHQKRLLAARGVLRIGDTVPPAMRHGPFARPFERPVACRFSNGQPCPFSDHDADVRGIGLKFFSPQGTECDILMTNEGGRTHARDAAEFLAVADVLVARIERGASGMLRELGEELHDHRLSVGEVLRIAGTLFKETALHRVRSLATEHYWGSVVHLGGAAFKHSLHPHPDTMPDPASSDTGADFLRVELLGRLARGPVRWRLSVQLFADEKTTPVNDASVAWAGEPVEIGELEIAVLPSPDDERAIDRMAFNPGRGFAPLGITRARHAVYEASARNRAGRGLMDSDGARRFVEGGAD